MTTAIDTNLVIVLWDRNSALSLAAQNALESAFNRGSLVAAAPVVGELNAAQPYGEVRRIIFRGHWNCRGLGFG